MTGGVVEGEAPAKLNLALVVGPLLPSGKHELVTVFQSLELADAVAVERAPEIEVRGFADDTIVTAALEALRREAGGTLAATIVKRVPVASGLGGGSSDAATALRLGNEILGSPVSPSRLAEIARELGADVPFFLGPSQQLGEGDGTRLTPLSLPSAYDVVLVMPTGVAKLSTAAVYAAFDDRRGEVSFDSRRHELKAALGLIETAADLALLPPNDLATSELAVELLARGAFRADVSGAGPIVYGLFTDRSAAEVAAGELARNGQTWVTRPRTDSA